MKYFFIFFAVTEFLSAGYFLPRGNHLETGGYLLLGLGFLALGLK